MAVAMVITGRRGSGYSGGKCRSYRQSDLAFMAFNFHVLMDP
jgi:hypothetical protein